MQNKISFDFKWTKVQEKSSQSVDRSSKRFSAIIEARNIYDHFRFLSAGLLPFLFNSLFSLIICVETLIKFRDAEINLWLQYLISRYHLNPISENVFSFWCFFPSIPLFGFFLLRFRYYPISIVRKENHWKV